MNPQMNPQMQPNFNMVSNDDNHPRYKTQPCNNYYTTGKCNFGEGCKFAHGDHELRPVPKQQRPGGPPGGGFKKPFRPNHDNRDHPDKYGPGAPNPKFRTQPCKFWDQFGNCKFGDKCKFSHEMGGPGMNQGMNPGMNQGMNPMMGDWGQPQQQQYGGNPYAGHNGGHFGGHPGYGGHQQPPPHGGGYGMMPGDPNQGYGGNHFNAPMNGYGGPPMGGGQQFGSM